MAGNKPVTFKVVSRTPIAPEMVQVIQKIVDDAVEIGRAAGRQEAVAQIAVELAKSRRAP